MLDFIEEVDGNFARFYAQLPNTISGAIKGLSANELKFKESYSRLVSLNAWRSGLIEVIASTEAQSFFIEAQNDALMSHSLARQGAWRVALMCLRSCIENTLYGIYYIDHPVELKQWHTGNFKLGFTETINYILKHPNLHNISEQICGIDIVKSEYSTLSKAVHGSSHSFRVTKSGDIEGLNIVSPHELGSWATRERATLIGLNQICIAIFKDQLQGSSNINLRKAISIVIPQNKHNIIKKAFNVRLFSIPAEA